MKLLKKLLGLGVVLFASTAINAQVSVNVNLGAPPAWGPAGYSNVDYYYLPDVQAYYDVPASQFIYLNGDRWTRSRYLPTQYRNYNLYNGYKVVLADYKGKTPYVNFKNDKVKYYKGYKGKPQKTIGRRTVSNKVIKTKSNVNGGNDKNRGNYKVDNNLQRSDKGGNGHGNENGGNGHGKGKN